MNQREAVYSHMLRPRPPSTTLHQLQAGCCLAVLLTLLLPPQSLHGAERLPTTPPLPVPRPRFEDAAPKATAPTRATPAPLLSPPAQTPSAGAAQPPVNDPLVRLGEFPREVQRDILRQCAAQWDRMKREGTTVGVIWRDFLGSCLPDRR